LEFAVRVALFAILGSLVHAGFGAAQGPVPLEWKFKEGDRFYAEVVTTFKHKLTLPALSPMNPKPLTISQELEQTSVLGFTVQKRNADNSYLIEEKIESWKQKAPGAVAVPDEKFGEKLQGAVFRVTVTSRGEILKLEGVKELVARLAGDDARAKAVLEKSLREDVMKASLADVFTIMPEKPVGPGQKWERGRTQPVTLLGSLSIASQYAYEGKEFVNGKQVDKLTYTATGKFTLLPPPAGSLPFEITGANLAFENARGTTYFDAELGRPVLSENKLSIEGTFDLKVSDTKYQTQLRQTQSNKIRILSENPAK
jgi:hypothetical protein